MQYISISIWDIIGRYEPFNEQVLGGEGREGDYGRMEVYMVGTVKWASNAIGPVFVSFKSGASEATTTI